MGVKLEPRRSMTIHRPPGKERRVAEAWRAPGLSSGLDADSRVLASWEERDMGKEKRLSSVPSGTSCSSHPLSCPSPPKEEPLSGF